MIAVIASDNMFRIITQLNRRGAWELERISGSNSSQVLSSIENGEGFTHIVIDIEAVRANVDIAIDTISRLHKTTTAQIVVIARDYEIDDMVCRDIKSVGIPEDCIVVGSETVLKKRLGELLPAGDPDLSPTFSIPDFPAPADPAPEIHRRGPVTPPSQIDRQTAAGLMKPKPTFQVNRRAVTIGVAGAGNRIGTTTQAMQLLLSLRASGYDAALVEMHEHPVMEMYLSLFPSKDIELIDEHHFTINGIDIFRKANALLKAKSAFDYVICDYGDFGSIADSTSFLDKDIKIMVCGIKPWESNKLHDIYAIDDGSIQYLFSFVPASDRPSVLAAMEDSRDNTFFAEYSPDFFNFCGADFYERIIGTTFSSPNGTKSKGKKLLTSLIGGFQK